MRSRRRLTPQESKLKPILENVAKKVYKTANPTVKKVGDAVTKTAGNAVRGYLSTTNAIADKLKPALEKLPKGKTRIRPRGRMRMHK